MGRVINFILYVFYYNKKKLGKKESYLTLAR